MKTTTLLLAATLCASGLAARPARAQMAYYGPVGIWPGNLYFSSQAFHNPEVKSSVRRSFSNIRKTKPRKALTTTTYRESPAVHKQVLTRFTNWVGTKLNATDAESISRDFENDMVGRWAKGVAEVDLKRGDVADALTSYWLVNWHIANRVTSDPKPAQVRAVRHLFVSVLSSTPAFARATNAQRQEMAEAFIYNSVLQGGAFGQIFRTGDQAQIKRYSDGRAASFKTEMGFDLRTMKLTNTGFAPK